MLDRLKRWLPGAPPPEPGAAPSGAAPAAPQPAYLGSPGVVVIDVRSELEFRAAAVETAVNLPLPQLQHRIRALVADTATPLVLYCASGARSGMACKLLKQLGYANVTNAGGLHVAAAQLQLELRR
jgi:phage shock protein E